MNQPSPESRMRPPWRSAAPGEKGRYVGFAILGFAAPWLVPAAAVLILVLESVYSTPESSGIPVWIAFALFLITLVMDLTGPFLAFLASSRTVRSLGWGAFIALLTHVIAVAIGILVLFGWCVSALNDLDDHYG